VKLPENRRPPEAAPDIAIHASPESRSYDDVPRQGPLEERKQLELLRAYYASVSYVDAQIGRVLAALEKNGLAESTVVVLVSDHGYHFGEHGMWNKLTNFEEATRSTLIVRAPGHPPGRCDRLVELLDIYPTLSELCGLPPPDGLAGASFAPLLVDPTATGKAAAFSQADPRGAMGYSIRTEQFRYVQWKRDGAMIAEELYDHQSDPGENVNVAGRGEFQAALAKMRKMASTWTEE
jgi:arylsulfatase A-like enzyme